EDAAEAAAAGDELSWQSAELAGVRKAQPAARLLTEVASFVGLPLDHLAGAALQGERRSRERVPVRSVGDGERQWSALANRKSHQQQTPRRHLLLGANPDPIEIGRNRPRLSLG